MKEYRACISRRDFIKVAGVAGVGSVMAASAGRAQETAKAEEPAQALKVPRRPFGKTGVDVSMLALGGIFDIVNNQIVLQQALKWGVTYWDTADCYNNGLSEEGIGAFFAKNPAARKDIFLVSKSDARDPKGIGKLLDRSLERMKTDYLDLYFIHGINGINEMTPEINAWAEQAKQDKKIRFFGFSTHSNMTDCLAGAAKLGWIDGIMMTYNFRLMQEDKMKAAVEACAKAGIGLTAMKTQGGGPVKKDSPAELQLAGRFLEKGFTDKQAKLKAVWDNPHIASVCSAMYSVTVLSANVAAALDKSALAAADRALFRALAQDTCSGYCAGCAAICAAAVAQAVPVADVMRYLMYHRDYREPDWARAQFRDLPAEQRARLTRLDFAAAEQACPQGLPIGRLMREAAQILA